MATDSCSWREVCSLPGLPTPHPPNISSHVPSPSLLTPPPLSKCTSLSDADFEMFFFCSICMLYFFVVLLFVSLVPAIIVNTFRPILVQLTVSSWNTASVVRWEALWMGRGCWWGNHGLPISLSDYSQLLIWVCAISMFSLLPKKKSTIYLLLFSFALFWAF